MNFRKYVWKFLSKLSTLVIRNTDVRIVTAADESHVKSLMQLLDSIKNSNGAASVSVYDLGLSSESVKKLSTEFPNLYLKQYRFDNLPPHEQMSYQAGSFAWKPKILKQELKWKEKYLVWMDAGNMLFDDIRNACLLSTPLIILAFSTGQTIRELTHIDTLKLMNSEGRISDNSQVSAAGLVIRNNRNGQRLVSEWSNWAGVKDVICPLGATRLNHRFDQSVISILISKNHFRKNAIDLLTKFGFNNEFFGFKIHQDLD